MRKIKRQLKKISKTALLSLVFSLTAIIFSMGLKVVLAVWQPAGSSPPLDNVYTLLDVSLGHQVKKGYLLIDPNYNPYGALPTINYPLEVKGAGADITSHLTVAGGFEVDNDTLFVDISNNRVGIGTRSPASTLNIEGGALNINSNVASVNALEGYSSGSHGVYGVSTATVTGKAGIYGRRFPTAGGDGAGVYGEGSIGVYGVSTNGIGVYAENNSGTNGAVYALNFNPSGWAGYFVGRVKAESEVVGNKFLPTTLQNSLTPYVSGLKIGDYNTDPDITSDPKELAFDGTHVWVANSGATTVGKVRASDGFLVYSKNILPPIDVTFDGSYVWATSNDASCANSGKVFKFNPFNPSDWTSYCIDSGAENIIATLDGTNKYIWYTSTATDAVKTIDTSGNPKCSYNTGLVDPQGLAFDGEYVWVANTGGNNILKIKFDAAPACTPTVQTISNSNIISPYRIIFDGTYIWVTNKTTPGTVTKIYAADGTVVNTYPTGINNPYDLAFDGTYIWVTHESSTQVVRLRASDGQGATSYDLGGGINYLRGVIFDGTYLWIGRGSGNTISKYYSGTGWGYPDLSAYLTLQGSTVVQQTGSFHIAGTAKLGGSFTAGGNIEAPNNTWDGSDTLRFMGESCPVGQFVKGVTYDPIVKWRTPEEVSYTDKAAYSGADVDRQGTFNGPTMALDSQGRPHITWVNMRDTKVCDTNRTQSCTDNAYCQGLGLGNCFGVFDIYYLKWNGSEWVTASGISRAQALLDPAGSNLNVSNVPATALQGASSSLTPSLALDTQGNAHISFYETYPRYVVHYLEWNPNYNVRVCSNNPQKFCEQDSECGVGNTCNSTGKTGAWVTVSGQHRDIALDDSDSPDRCPGTSYTGDRCNLVVDKEGNPSLVLDSQGRPHIAYIRSGEIYYRWWDPTANGGAGGWVDADPGDGNYNDDVNLSNTALDSHSPKLALGSETPQRPHIVWIQRVVGDGGYGEVHYRWWNGVAWVDADPSDGPDDDIQVNINVVNTMRAGDPTNNMHTETPDLDLDSNNWPAIVWRDPIHVFYRHWNGSNWVSASGSAGGTDLKVNIEGNILNPPFPAFNYSASPSRPVVRIYNDLPYVAWSNYRDIPDPDLPNEVHFRRWNGTNWVTVSGNSGQGVNDSNLNVSQSSTLYSLSPSLVVDPTLGIVHVAWFEKAWIDGSGCSGSVCTTDANCSAPYYHCAWYSWSCNKCANFDIYYNRSGTNELLCRPL